eukprot:TRINITY_DN136_c0_g1_i1.p1 TRINITY_DN136_c0_g1~~TRINITY_DN136_c0_g1_i1.p1  ORF type:complete len:222 (-),score=50.51 TRINITY_DN136_c0_g1_i1:89-721(-)
MRRSYSLLRLAALRTSVRQTQWKARTLHTSRTTRKITLDGSAIKAAVSDDKQLLRIVSENPELLKKAKQDNEHPFAKSSLFETIQSKEQELAANLCKAADLEQIKNESLEDTFARIEAARYPAKPKTDAEKDALWRKTMQERVTRIAQNVEQRHKYETGLYEEKLKRGKDAQSLLAQEVEVDLSTEEEREEIKRMESVTKIPVGSDPYPY